MGFKTDHRSLIHDSAGKGEEEEEEEEEEGGEEEEHQMILMGRSLPSSKVWRLI
jgi:hypothetical protein